MAKWQRWEHGVRQRSYKALPPPFRIRGFLGNRSRYLCFSEFSATARWAVVDVLPLATRLGVPGTVICSEGYRRLQELDGKRRETMIYTGSACRKVTAPYVQSGVDSILRPALCRVARYVVVVSSVGYV